jgi:hypothetical protein
LLQPGKNAIIDVEASLKNEDIVPQFAHFALHVPDGHLHAKKSAAFGGTTREQTDQNVTAQQCPEPFRADFKSEKRHRCDEEVEEKAARAKVNWEI